ncbi:unnamed protein product [Ilex paraguariensis]|uniref:Uncharacterized protein n=1 Tax=Ilex paraguariensis TaxID=185542 RepID=A0ABC8S319_9AQUA
MEMEMKMKGSCSIFDMSRVREGLLAVDRIARRFPKNSIQSTLRSFHVKVATFVACAVDRALIFIILGDLEWLFSWR